MYKHAKDIEPGNEIIVDGKTRIVELASHQGKAIFIKHSNGRFHCQPEAKILLALSREDAVTEALQIMDKAELP